MPARRNDHVGPRPLNRQREIRSPVDLEHATPPRRRTGPPPNHCASGPASECGLWLGESLEPLDGPVSEPPPAEPGRTPSNNTEPIRTEGGEGAQRTPLPG